MEQVDIVDKNDKVLYQTYKEVAHKKGLLHRCVVSQVKDSKGRWLLVKQAKDRQDAGQYVSPVGGHVQAGETEDQALKRETLEELGIKDVAFQFIGKAIFNRTVLERLENHYFALYEIYSDQKPAINHESESYKYFTEEEITKTLKENPKLFGDAFHHVVKNFYQSFLK